MSATTREALSLLAEGVPVPEVAHWLWHKTLDEAHVSLLDVLPTGGGET